MLTASAMKELGEAMILETKRKKLEKIIHDIKEIKFALGVKDVEVGTVRHNFDFDEEMKRFTKTKDEV